MIAHIWFVTYDLKYVHIWFEHIWYSHFTVCKYMTIIYDCSYMIWSHMIWNMLTYDLNIYDLITYDHIRISYMLNTYETIYACHIWFECKCEVFSQCTSVWDHIWLIIYDLITYDLKKIHIWLIIYDLTTYDLKIIHIWFDCIWRSYMICDIWFATYDHIRDLHMIIYRFWHMIPYMIDLSNHIRKTDEMRGHDREYYYYRDRKTLPISKSKEYSYS